MQDGWERRTLGEVNLTVFWIGREEKNQIFSLVLDREKQSIFRAAKACQGQKEGKMVGFFSLFSKAFKED